MIYWQKFLSIYTNCQSEPVNYCQSHLIDNHFVVNRLTHRLTSMMEMMNDMIISKIHWKRIIENVPNSYFINSSKKKPSSHNNGINGVNSCSSPSIGSWKWWWTTMWTVIHVEIDCPMTKCHWFEWAIWNFQIGSAVVTNPLVRPYYFSTHPSMTSQTLNNAHVRNADASRTQGRSHGSFDTIIRQTYALAVRFHYSMPITRMPILSIYCMRNAAVISISLKVLSFLSIIFFFKKRIFTHLVANQRSTDSHAFVWFFQIVANKNNKNSINS